MRIKSYSIVTLKEDSDKGSIFITYEDDSAYSTLFDETDHVATLLGKVITDIFKKQGELYEDVC